MVGGLTHPQLDGVVFPRPSALTSRAWRYPEMTKKMGTFQLDIQATHGQPRAQGPAAVSPQGSPHVDGIPKPQFLACLMFDRWAGMSTLIESNWYIYMFYMHSHRIQLDVPKCVRAFSDHHTTLRHWIRSLFHTGNHATWHSRKPRRKSSHKRECKQFTDCFTYLYAQYMQCVQLRALHMLCRCRLRTLHTCVQVSTYTMIRTWNALHTVPACTRADINAYMQGYV